MEKEKDLRYSCKEKRLIEFVRKLEFGEIKIIVQDGVPIRIEEMKKSIKL